MHGIKPLSNKRFYLLAFIAVQIIIIFYLLYSIILLYNPPYSCRDCNVILITTDSLRADHVSSYGYGRNTTPNIDKIAKRGILFENYIVSGPLTYISLPSIMSSKHPVLTKWHVEFENSSETSLFYLNDSYYTLPEHLNKYGYMTAAFTVTGWTKYTNMDKGFILKDNILDAGVHEDEIAKERVINFLNDTSSKKFFIWVHFQSPHSPYTPLPPYNESFIGDSYSSKYGIHNVTADRLPYFINPGNDESVLLDVDHLVSQYDGEIKYIDSQIGEIMDYLESRKMAGNTVVIISSDHGESLSEHNFYFEHELLYDDQIKSPLVIFHPKLEGAPRRIYENIQTIDLYPTIIEILNLPKAREKIDGKSFSSLISGNAFNERPAYFVSIAENFFGFRNRKWKYIHNTNGSEEIYNLVADPGELNNLLTKDKNALLLIDYPMRLEIKKRLNKK